MAIGMYLSALENYPHEPGDQERLNYYFGTPFERGGDYYQALLDRSTSGDDSWFADVLGGWKALEEEGVSMADRMGCIVPGHTYLREASKGQYSERFFSSHDLAYIGPTLFTVVDADAWPNPDDTYHMKIEGVTLTECLPGEPWAKDPMTGEEWCWITGNFESQRGGTAAEHNGGHGTMHIKLQKIATVF